MKMLKVEGQGGVEVAQKLANQALQRGFDQAKLALLPMFYFVLPLVAIFAIVVIELLLPLFRSSWQLALWRKVVYWLYIILFIFLVMLIIGTLSFIHAHPKEFCEFALGGSWTSAPTCTVFGAIFDALK